MAELIGRTREKDILKKIVQSDSSEFIVIYGRRRVGKTFLIREYFKNKFHFQITGLADANTKQQLANFQTTLSKYTQNTPKRNTKNWFEAFQELITYLESVKDKKKIVFIDELPWLDTPKSNFISALEHFWNSWASARKDIILIGCGSAASWIINKLINNKGGLHNRVTQKIKLSPFSLHECELFLKSRNIQLNRYQIVELYMAMGGIPYYLNAISPGLSASQNIDQLFFSEDGLLKNEFNNLYASLFKNADNHVQIIEALSKKAQGLTRETLLKAAKIPNGGGATKVLAELEASGFIRKYIPFNKKNRESLYQLNDFYSLFYYKFIHHNKLAKENYWTNAIDSPAHRAWSGYAFEQVCLAHVFQIKKALGIHGIQSVEASWVSKNEQNGAQIDLLIDRRDHIINICEIKFSINPFVIDKKYAAVLQNKIGVFKTETQTRKAIFLTMISTYGLKSNEYSLGFVQNSITPNDLFQ
jgi:uncharacterized protein